MSQGLGCSLHDEKLDHEGYYEPDAAHQADCVEFARGHRTDSGKIHAQQACERAHEEEEHVYELPPGSSHGECEHDNHHSDNQR